MLILDVGCGRRPKGNVNVDISKDYHVRIPKREFEKAERVGHFRETKDIPNFALASAYALPFRDHVFQRVTSAHLLEHLINPYKALEEMARVCNGEIAISVPHRFSAKTKAKERGHVSFLNATWFVRAFRALGINDYDIRSLNQYLPHPMLPLFAIPYELRVNCWLSVSCEN